MALSQRNYKVLEPGTSAGQRHCYYTSHVSMIRIVGDAKIQANILEADFWPSSLKSVPEHNFRLARNPPQWEGKCQWSFQVFNLRALCQFGQESLSTAGERRIIFPSRPQSASTLRARPRCSLWQRIQHWLDCVTTGSETCPPAFSASPLRIGIEHSADPEIPALNLTLLLTSRPSGGDIVLRTLHGAFGLCGDFKCPRQSARAGSALKRGTLRFRGCERPDASCCTVACLRHSEPA